MNNEPSLEFRAPQSTPCKLFSPLYLSSLNVISPPILRTSFYCKDTRVPVQYGAMSRIIYHPLSLFLSLEEGAFSLSITSRGGVIIVVGTTRRRLSLVKSQHARQQPGAIASSLFTVTRSVYFQHKNHNTFFIPSIDASRILQQQLEMMACHSLSFRRVRVR